MSSEQINWSRMSLEELQTTWNTEVEPNLQREGIDLDDRPTYQEVADAGYGGIAYALREHHDLTLTEFLATVGYVDPDDDDTYQWGIDDETTVDALEALLRRVERKRAETTADSKRYRLATYVRLYETVHGTAAIADRVMDEENEYDELRRVEAVLYELDDELESPESKLRYLSDIRQWYEHLETRHGAPFNPAENVDHDDIWRGELDDEKDNPALSSDQVGKLYNAVESPDEELLVLALCAWGLRRSEVASLHVSQLVLEGDDPHIAFDERKNGPGTVALIYGVPELADRVDALGSDDRDWSGYLFPSRKSSSGHITGETVQTRFKRLAERAEVLVRGDWPTSKMGRRFWYTTYNQAMNDLLNNLDAIAGDQGSSDASVVLKNYLSEAERRKYRREFMRDRLEEVFAD
ncbi:tyrosine-type recombinase/integrase (plasmid) [Haloterrigena salifodinae]|uniref:Tyrosine-type recombinase/integrase n=1 Tax=Haloterrigena salifodinae TaxID=2675099 RepID=A0A8T8E8M1_9EURY|nr:tyrosine-type recombinase/integrase [Haloterrigena salifodinae]QRV17900.1 tyrosine-type recombinase/integrase [Haloterrigena salifodinae]